MQPVRQVGPSVAVAASATANVAASVNGAAVVLVTNLAADNTTPAYFSPMVGAATGAWPPVVDTNANPVPEAGMGIPIPAGKQVLVAIGGSVDYYAAQGAALIVTPVEIMRTL